MKSVLYVEDQQQEGEIIGRLLCSVFRRCFHGEVEFHVEATLAGGRAYIASKNPNVILLDLGLPDSRTDDTALVIKELSKSTPVVVLTGHEERAQELRLMCFANGAEDFCLKISAHRHAEELCERVYHAFLRFKYHGNGT